MFFKKLQLKLINIRCKFIIYALVLLTAGMFSCRPARHIEDGYYLLDRYRIESPGRDIDKDELRDYVRQKQNKRILGLRFHLWLYNMADPEKDGWPHNWLRRIGEEPVIYNSQVTSMSSSHLRQHLRNMGYYNAEVEDTVHIKKKKARVKYMIEPGKPYHISSLGYVFEDTGLKDIVLGDTVNSLIKPGDIFDIDMLQDERRRLETLIRNAGYYNFSREHVFFNADTTSGNKAADLTLGISLYRERREDGEFVLLPHQRYMIGNVYIVPSYDLRESIDLQEDYYADMDTLEFRGMYYLYRNEVPVRYRVLAQKNFILPGEIYNQDNVDLTYRHLFALRQYRLVDIQFTSPPESNPDSLGLQRLDARLHLTPFNMQSYTVELEGTNSSGDFGFGGNLMYQNRNIFRGAEILDFKIKGSVETLNDYYSRSFRNTYEYGAELGLQIPRLLLPIRSISFVRRYNPRTNISIAYNYQTRPDYTRTIANAGFGYNWRGSGHTTHIINPVELNLVRLPFSTPLFDSTIHFYNLEASFKDHLVSETNYSFVYNNQDLRLTRDFVYFRVNAEIAGNTLAAISNLAQRPKKNGFYQVGGTEFAQYFKTDIDLRYYKMLYGDNSLVYRFFAGAGLPYGNSSALPFIKKYFSGGANSIRAWQVRSLGPGSFNEPANRSFPNRTADIKLEANLEYRFKLFWLMEGAMFLDAGNIWAINHNDKREGALFRFSRFYNDIAVGTGLGLRFDFSFFIFRVDMGLKIRDPAEPIDRRWIPLNRGFNFNNDLAFNIGIGYPF